MKLRTVQVREFKSVWDSNAFDIDNAVCLVGKNEAGKTALLQALYRLNPIIEEDGIFDVTHDYPRSEVEDYQQDIESKRRQHAEVITATFALESPELEAICAEYGEGVLKKAEVIVSKGYAGENGKSTRYVRVPVVESALVRNLINRFKLSKSLRAKVAQNTSLATLSEHLKDLATQQAQKFATAQTAANQIEDEDKKADALEKNKALAESEEAKELRAKLTELVNHGDLGIHIWHTFLAPYFPKFLYFDEYYQMLGHDNLEALKERKATGKLTPSDRPLLGLIELARLDLDQLLSANSTQDLKNKLQGASTYLSKQILRYWSQNKHLEMRFDVRQGLPGDPEGMRNGHNIWGEVYDKKRLASTGIGTRSAGFVWFFSFLAWYSAEKKKDEPLVLLLDEPGLSLHGKAQQDLLRYFDAEIITNPKHQLLYTTHSPFMVDPQHFERVRIVQDRGIDADHELPREEDGTKVFTDVLEATPDSLFPLQAALGYEICQTLFIGPNSLVVEGPSDLLYIQAISALLQDKGETGLSSDWTISHAQGLGKIPAFVALIGAQKNLNVAVLVDYKKKDQQSIENLYKTKLLKKNQVLTYADFVSADEADVEDMFNASFYLKLVNGEFGSSVAVRDLARTSPRILVRLENHLKESPLPNGAKFNHYRPARYFRDNIATLESTLTESELDRFREVFSTLNDLL